MQRQARTATLFDTASLKLVNMLEVPQVIDNFVSGGFCASVMNLVRDSTTMENLPVDLNTIDASYRKSQTMALHGTLKERLMATLRDKLFGHYPVLLEFEVVCYSSGGFFHLHHDAYNLDDDDQPIYDDDDTKTNPRVATLFIYMNDTNAGEGNTYFPRKNIRVQPQAGRAVLFRNVLPPSANATFVPDMTTIHAGEPINSGTKVGINVFVRANRKLL